MRIVNRKTFLVLPPGTVFSEYEPCVFTGLFIKTETCRGGGDYCEQDLIGNVKCHDSGEFGEILEDARENGQPFDLDFNVDCRNGCFNFDQLYVVYETKDIQQLIERLRQCCPEESE
jgi:hypothetical protein